MSATRTKRKKSLRAGFLMDPIEKINLKTDTTFVMMLESQARGHELFYFTPADAWVEDGRPMAKMSPVKVKRPTRPGMSHFSLGRAAALQLSSLDLVFMRVDPPYSLEYVTALQTLALVPPPSVVVNRPRGVLLANEKILAMHFPELMPPTLVTHDSRKLFEFMDRVGGSMVLKPLEGFGGEGVLLVEKKHANAGAIIEMMTENGKRQVMAQKRLPVEKAGDKRIIMLGGEPIGAVLRMPAMGSHRANLHSGGRAVKTTITDRDLEIARAVGPLLRREGLYIAGLDVIAGFLTEINMTSPTLVQQINELDHVRLEQRIMDFCVYLSETARSMKG